MDEKQIKRGRKPKTKDYNSKFAQKLRDLLTEKESEGIILITVAKELGITRQSLAQYRDGNNIPDIMVLERMADYFNVSTDYLLGRTIISSPDSNVKLACEYTGLTPKVVEHLHLNDKFVKIKNINSAYDACRDDHLYRELQERQDAIIDELERIGIDIDTISENCIKVGYFTCAQIFNALVEDDGFIQLLDEMALYLSCSLDKQSFTDEEEETTYRLWKVQRKLNPILECVYRKVKEQCNNNIMERNLNGQHIPPQR